MINPTELLTVVDQNNNLLDPLPRKDVHAANLWHRTTGIWVLNKNKQILCQKRSMLKDQNPGKWEAYFGGHLEYNEDITESAVREVSEELGQSVAANQFIPYSKVVKSDKPTHREFQYVFMSFLNSANTNFEFEKDEIEELKWISFDEVKNILMIAKDASWVHKPWDKEILNWLETPFQRTTKS